MESKYFFTTYFLENTQTCKEQFSSLSFENKYNIFIDSLSEVSFAQFQYLCRDIIPTKELEFIMQYNDFIAFEYALDSLEYFGFLLKNFARLVPRLLKTTNILLYALQLRPISIAQEAVFLLKSGVISEDWVALLLDNDGRIPRAMTQNFDAYYTWLQCKSLSLEQRRQIYSADNYMIFRQASLLGNRGELLEGMCAILGDDANNAVNAYGGDIVYQALVYDDIFVFNGYYPKLSEFSVLNLRERIQIESPEKMSIFDEYVRRLQTASIYHTPPRNYRNTYNVSTPNSITDFQTPRKEAKSVTSSKSMGSLPAFFKMPEIAASAKVTSKDDTDINFFGMSKKHNVVFK